MPIYIPNNTDATTVKQHFYGFGRFPGVIGAIDATHVQLITSSKDKHLFVNRKSNHSINIQKCINS